jgi:hypothetical protein
MEGVVRALEWWLGDSQSGCFDDWLAEFGQTNFVLGSRTHYHPAAMDLFGLNLPSGCQICSVKYNNKNQLITMQINKINTRFQKQLSVFCLTLFSITSVYAANPWLQGLGVVSDLITTSGFVSESKTTLSPAYAVHMWRNDYYGYYANRSFANHGRVDRDPILGVVKFYKKYQYTDGSFEESKDEFSLLYLRRRSFSCNRSTVDSTGALIKDVVNELEDFSIIMWHNVPPQKTGPFPPGPPYRFVAQTSAERIVRNCNPIQPANLVFEAASTIGDYGYVTAKFHRLDYEFAWPLHVYGEEK